MTSNEIFIVPWENHRVENILADEGWAVTHLDELLIAEKQTQKRRMIIETGVHPITSEMYCLYSIKTNEITEQRSWTCEHKAQAQRYFYAQVMPRALAFN